MIGKDSTQVMHVTDRTLRTPDKRCGSTCHRTEQLHRAVGQVVAVAAPRASRASRSTRGYPQISSSAVTRRLDPPRRRTRGPPRSLSRPFKSHAAESVSMGSGAACGGAQVAESVVCSPARRPIPLAARGPGGPCSASAENMVATLLERRDLKLGTCPRCRGRVISYRDLLPLG
jgi:hypothetical protein